jgi:hypothetical protein
MTSQPRQRYRRHRRPQTARGRASAAGGQANSVSGDVLQEPFQVHANTVIHIGMCDVFSLRLMPRTARGHLSDRPARNSCFDILPEVSCPVGRTLRNGLVRTAPCRRCDAVNHTTP